MALWPMRSRKLVLAESGLDVDFRLHGNFNIERLTKLNLMLRKASWAGLI